MPIKKNENLILKIHRFGQWLFSFKISQVFVEEKRKT